MAEWISVSKRISSRMAPFHLDFTDHRQLLEYKVGGTIGDPRYRPVTFRKNFCQASDARHLTLCDCSLGLALVEGWKLINTGQRADARFHCQLTPYYIARQLAGIGLRLDRQSRVRRQPHEMRVAVEEAVRRADVLIIMADSPYVRRFHAATW